MTDPTALDLDAIEARASVATDGPWSVHLAGTGIRGSTPYAFVIAGANIPVAERHNGGTVADVEFMASARTDVPALVAEVRRLRAAIARVHGFADGMEREAPMPQVGGFIAQDLRRVLDDPA